MPLAALNDVSPWSPDFFDDPNAPPSIPSTPPTSGFTSGGFTSGGGGYTPPPAAGGGFDFGDFLNQFPKLTSGISTVISAARGNPYSQTAGGASSSSPYGAVQPVGGALSFGASPTGGLFGGISTTTLLIIGLVAFAFLGGRRR